MFVTLFPTSNMSWQFSTNSSIAGSAHHFSPLYKVMSSFHSHGIILELRNNGIEGRQ